MATRPTPIGARGCVCNGCHRSFTSPSAFDKHQRLASHGVECRHPMSVGLEPREHASGERVWGYPAWDATKKSMPWGPAA